MLALACLSASGTAVFAHNYDKGLAAYERGDFEEALQEWRPLAEQGNAEAQHRLGYMYLIGEGVLEDDAEAERWFRFAAERGDIRAQGNLGLKYKKGEGVPQNDVLAHMWLSIAAANGNARHRINRDVVEVGTTPTDISEAQERTRICMASGYSDCD